MGGPCAVPIIGYVTSSTVRIMPAIPDQRAYDRVSFRGCFAVRFPRSLKLITRIATGGLPSRPPPASLLLRSIRSLVL